MIGVPNVSLLRILYKIFPVKRQLSFLVKDYLNNAEVLQIPYHQNYSILIQPNPENKSTIADLIFEGANYLPEIKLVNVFLRLLPPNYCYVDVGSNIGTTIWLFAKGAKRIIAYEPIPKLNNAIHQSIEFNRSTNVILRRLAVGNAPGEVKMVNNNNSSIVDKGGEDTVKIKVTTLDLSLREEERIDLIKIDVEGYEVKVLEGAREIIKRHRPLLLIELHPGFILNYQNTYEDVICLVESLSYKIRYYSFLDYIKDPKWQRVARRWLPKKFKHFDSKQNFVEYLSSNKQIMSYHLFCEPA